jgi:hypothetical protein
MKIVNNRFEKIKQNGQIQKGVSFDTKQYFDEALKLSQDPKSYREKNPITKFVPANSVGGSKKSSFN